MEDHIKRHCINTLIKCKGCETGCKTEDKRILIYYHQIECNKVEDFQTIDYPLYSKLYCILVGVGDYQYSNRNFENLKAPKNDVIQCKNRFGKMGFQKSEENYLIDKDATKENIENLLKKTEEMLEGKDEEESRINSKSMLLFYFSGHGMEDKNKTKFQICPHDFKSDSQENGIDLQYLADRFLKMNCKHSVLILDSCFSGGIFRYIKNNFKKKIPFNHFISNLFFLFVYLFDKGNLFQRKMNLKENLLEKKYT